MNSTQINNIRDALIGNDFDTAAKMLAPRCREYDTGFYDQEGVFFTTFDPVRPNQDYSYMCAAGVDYYVISIARTEEGQYPVEFALTRFQHDALLRAIYLQTMED